MKISGYAVIEDNSGVTVSFATRVEGIEGIPISFPAHNPIAFTKGKLESFQDKRDIWTMRPDGSGMGKLELAKEITGVPTHPAWSPDGTRIAFGVSQGKKDKAQWSLWVHELANASAIQIASFNVGKGNIWQPAWSPDGTQIAFEHGIAKFKNGVLVEDARVNREIFVVGVAANTKPTQLTDTPAGDSNHATWSPDGSRIAFAQSGDIKSSKPYQIMLMNSDGTGIQVLTPGSDPSWSPDGNSIAFALGEKGFKTPTNIHLIRLDNKSQTQQLTSSPEDDLDPTWSPDGKKILFTHSRTGDDIDTDIWSMNADGSGTIQLTSSKTDRFWAPSWRRRPVPLPKFRFQHKLTVPTIPVPVPGDNPLWTFTTEITAS